MSDERHLRPISAIKREYTIVNRVVCDKRATTEQRIYAQGAQQALAWVMNDNAQAASQHFISKPRKRA